MEMLNYHAVIIPPMKLSPLRPSPVASSPSSSRARSDIDKRVRDMEMRMVTLQTRASQRAQVSGPRMSQRGRAQSTDDEASALRHQIDALQTEMARLRAEQQHQTMVEPPPAYSTARNSAM